MSRRSLIAAGAALAAFAAVVARRRRRPHERVTVGFDDGSSLTLESGSPDADRLLAIARPAVER
jgi:hypothetical protein